MNRPFLIIISGPTGIGKSRLAVEMVQAQGEIISADSMQVYQHLDIGTAKPEEELLKKVKHHLISIIDPAEDYSAFHFVRDAGKIIPNIIKQNKIPFIVGGTGLYIRSLLYGLSRAPGRDDVYRRELARIGEEHGLASLYQELIKIDPVYARVIDPHDKARIIRALEVHHKTGQAFSAFIQSHSKEPRYSFLWIGLSMPRPELYDLINKRTQGMYSHGLLEETESLIKRGYAPILLKKKAIGYAEAIDHLLQKIDLDEAVERTAKKTRHYAKRQMTWFRKEKEIKWFHPEDKAGIRKCIQDRLDQGKEHRRDYDRKTEQTKSAAG